ncbi:MAG: AI-2E family transporter [Actinomycetales bacterium]|nr:AI-2E family transporter [Actinomycetales bacterium]
MKPSPFARRRADAREQALRGFSSDASEAVSPGMRVAAAWSWRILVVAAVVALVGFLIVQLRDIAVPFFVAVLLAALFVPLKNLLVRHGWPRGLAVALCMVLLVAIVGGLVTLVVFQVRGELPSLQRQADIKYHELLTWLQGPPFELSAKDIDGYLGQIWTAIQADLGSVLSGALSVGTTAGHVLTGALLVLFSLIFLLLDGGRIWAWVTGLFPTRARAAIRGAGAVGWGGLSSFVRVQVFVAAVDAVGIGLGAAILGGVGQWAGWWQTGFPLVIPIAVIVFLASFVPFVGAIVSGAIAVLVALGYYGVVPAIVMLGIVILVQQLEAHVLQPFVIGSAVRVHPLAIVLSVAAGGFVAGIAGTLFAVPLAVVLSRMIGYLVRQDWRHGDAAAPAAPRGGDR